VARPIPLRQSVYEALVELIVVGGLPAGQHLVEAELARRLGVSRQPVREALHRLEAEGWVDIRPAQGAFVHVPTEQEIDQLCDVRGLLEAEAARLAARAATPEAIVRLREGWRAGLDAFEADDLERVVAANAALHAQVTVLSGNAVIAELSAQVERRMRWYYRPVAFGRGRESWIEHAALIDAIEAGDEDAAAAIMRAHTQHTKAMYHEQTPAAGR